VNSRFFDTYDELFQHVFDDLIQDCIDDNTVSGIDDCLQVNNNIIRYHCGRHTEIYPSSELLQRMYQQASQQLHDELNQPTDDQ
jgi:hypothetical protein